MNLPWFWYAGVVVSVALCCTPYIMLKLEERSDRRDRDAWEALHR